MQPRIEKLLEIIIDTYIEKSQPVGSLELADFLGCSSATIRNEMSKLEDAGYLEQPHTSAGRMPTEEAYLYYTKHFLKERQLAKKEQQQLRRALRPAKKELGLKQLAREISALVKQVVVVGFAPTSFYYTGFSHLFQQPEFLMPHSIQHFSAIIDQMDEIAEEFFSLVNNEVNIFVGRENPINQASGLVLTKYHTKTLPAGVIGILGPLRMDYSRNITLLTFVRDLLART